MRNDKKREIQHYVPKLLLRGFAERRGDDNWQIGVFDKLVDKRFLTNIKNIAAETGFYEGKIDDKKFSAEELLTKIESDASSAIEKIKAQNSLSALTSGERLYLALFIAAQFLRSKTAREQMKDIDRAITDRIRNMGHDPAELANFKMLETDDEVKLHSISFLGTNVTEIARTLLQKNLSLFTTAASLPLWIGDNPVVLHNSNDYGPYGNLGFSVRGIEIYMPISSTQIIGMLCPSILAGMREAYVRGKVSLTQVSPLSVLNLKSDPSVLRQQRCQLEKSLANIERAIGEFTSNEPIECKKDNIDFFNALQARSAERFVMARTNDFDDVEKMLANTEVAKRGPRWRIN